MSLREIFCQDKAIDSLQRAFGAGRMGHAYIFSGADGVGKDTAARAWAKMLVCHDRVEEATGGGVFYDSCGRCESCRVFESGGHADFRPIYKELVEFTKKGKDKTTPIDMPIDVIREFLIDKVSNKPTMGEYVVYVVREAEKLNKSSQNALLKVLEEPPGYCVIILLCSRLDKMLPTTRSRCQVVRFGEIEEGRIRGKLEEMGVESEEALFWARFCGGSLGEAISWSKIELEEGNCYEIKKKLVRSLAAHELADSVDFAEWMCDASKRICEGWGQVEKSTSKKDLVRRGQKGLIRMVGAVFSDVMRVNVEEIDGLVNSDQMDEISSLAGRFDAEAATEKVSKAYESMRWVEASVNEKLIFEELLLNLAGCGIFVS